MIKEFYHSENQLYSINAQNGMMVIRHNKLLKYLKGKVFGKVFEADQRNPLTEKIEERFNCKVDTVSTCDFNFDLKAPDRNYDTIISSHVIEHLPNPLTYLCNIFNLMKPGGKLHIVYPQRPKFLWTDHHFHEIDDYRFRLIAKEAGFTVLSLKKWKIEKDISEYLKGIKPLFRLIIDKEVCYLLEK